MEDLGTDLGCHDSFMGWIEPYAGSSPKPHVKVQDVSTGVEGLGARAEGV